EMYDVRAQSHDCSGNRERAYRPARGPFRVEGKCPSPGPAPADGRQRLVDGVGTRTGSEIPTSEEFRGPSCTSNRLCEHPGIACDAASVGRVHEKDVHGSSPVNVG